MEAHVTLIGAGPGDKDLITVKGIKALQQADAILYDDLANEELLEYAAEHTIKIYVGKRSGMPSFRQEEINGLMVHLAHSKGHVVRLKGGDGFVFGRGYEEMEFARKHNIPCEIIPGISSCIAVPEALEIPVTKRGVSESFWVITGTTRKGEISEDIRLAAQSQATVIILMGMSKLEEICEIYKTNNKENLPMAVIQNGTRADQRSVIGQVWEMPYLVKEQNIGTPAIMVIGEVVGLHPSYTMEYINSNYSMESL